MGVERKERVERGGGRRREEEREDRTGENEEEGGVWWWWCVVCCGCVVWLCVCVHLSRLEPAQLHRYGLSVLAEYRGTLSLLLLLQLLISAPLSWKHFTNYKSTYEPIHACEFMWTVSCALSGVCRIGVCVQRRNRTGLTFLRTSLDLSPLTGHQRHVLRLSFVSEVKQVEGHSPRLLCHISF